MKEAFKLVDKNGHTVNRGDTVTSFRGETATVVWFKEGFGGSTGRVCVRDHAGWEQAFYPSVFDLKIVAA